MRRLFVLAMLVVSTLAGANTYTLEVGSGLMKLNRYGYPYYHFRFIAYDYPYWVQATNNEDLSDRAGIQLCARGTPCEDPTEYTTLLYMSDNAPYQGKVEFDAISFIVSTTKYGNLKVVWTASADIHLRNRKYTNTFEWDPNVTWTVTAYFKPDPMGGWDFWKAQFVSAR